jgi:predicted TIM-barrel fold metal-dependent hydrolase
MLAHCGAGPPPLKSNYQKMIQALLTTYPNLYFDIAGMHVDFYNEKGVLTELGKILLEVIKKFPDRFMVGFDLCSDDYTNPSQTQNKVNLYRRFLGNLPDAVAEKVASGNARLIFGLK